MNKKTGHTSYHEYTLKHGQAREKGGVMGFKSPQWLYFFIFFNKCVIYNIDDLAKKPRKLENKSHPHAPTYLRL